MRRIASLKCTIFLLACFIVLVIAGTLAQTKLSTTDAQERFFRSLFLYWHTDRLRIPIFPGGYLLTGLLCLNMGCALIQRRIPLRNHLGLYLLHIALFLLLCGETLGSFYAKEWYLPLKVGERANTAFDTVKDTAHPLPFSVQLVAFVHETHPRTDVPKHFSSAIEIYAPEGQLLRSARIVMNQPLRYHGMTFYQAGFGQEEIDSVLKIVSNPFAITPYLFSCLLIAGLCVQFTTPLVKRVYA